MQHRGTANDARTRKASGGQPPSGARKPTSHLSACTQRSTARNTFTFRGARPPKRDAAFVQIASSARRLVHSWGRRDGLRGARNVLRTRTRRDVTRGRAAAPEKKAAPFRRREKLDPLESKTRRPGAPCSRRSARRAHSP